MKEIPAQTQSFRSLRITLIFAFLAIGITAIFTSSAFEIYFNFQSQQKVFESQQKLIAQNAADTVKEFFAHKLSMLEEAADISDLITASSEQQDLTMSKLLGSNESFTQLFLLNTEGNTLRRRTRLSRIASIPFTNETKQDMSLIVLKGGKLHQSRLY